GPARWAARAPAGGDGVDRPAAPATPAGVGDGRGRRAARTGRGYPGRLPGADPPVLAPHPRQPARRAGGPPPDAGRGGSRGAAGLTAGPDDPLAAAGPG